MYLQYSVPQELFKKEWHSVSFRTIHPPEDLNNSNFIARWRKDYHVLSWSKIQAKLRVVCVALKSTQEAICDSVIIAPPAILKGCFKIFSSPERKSNVIAMFLFSCEELRDNGYYSFKTGGKVLRKESVVRGRFEKQQLCWKKLIACVNVRFRAGK